MRIPLIRIQYSQEDITFIKNAVEDVLRSGYLTMADNVAAFEKQFAAYCGTNYAVGTNSGTSALEIILRAIGVEQGVVVMPSNTYMATPLAAIKAGAGVLFTECERDTLQMCPRDLENKLRKYAQADIKAGILVHIGGIISPRLNELLAICADNGLPLIEDAAHAHGATYKNIKAGNLAAAGAFSFYPTKVLTTAEGGMITTNDETIFNTAICLREHGKADAKFNIHTHIGDNWRFSELHAVLGLQQMKKADAILERRRALAALYDDLLQDTDAVQRVIIPADIASAYYKYILFLPPQVDRQPLKDRLREEFGVELPGEVYSHPCHSQPVFKTHPQKLANLSSDRFPVTDDVCRRHICLPLYPGLTDEEVEYVVHCLKAVL